MSEGKLDFAGKAWVDKATEVLEALVNEHGDEDAFLLAYAKYLPMHRRTYPQVVRSLVLLHRREKCSDRPRGRSGNRCKNPG